jgi:glycosyltransferase involved in cell wall biosynthesis
VHPRRILLLNTDLELGGTPTVVRELAVRLRDPGRVHVDVACLSRWGPVADQLQAHGVHVTALNARGAHDVAVFHRLNHLIGARLIDTVFSFLVHANTAAAVARLFLHDVRYLQSIQTTQPNPRWHWVLQRIVHHAGDRVVVPSEAVAYAARAWAGVPNDKIAVIPNAIDPAEFPRSPVPLDDPRPFPIGFIGRLDPIKQVPELVRQFTVLVRTWRRDAHLHIYGQGGDEARIRQAIAHAGVEDRVTLHGPVARPQDALSQLGLLVLPSAAEGFGLVLIEAMAAGVPVVGNNAPGIRNVIRNGETGLLAEPTHPTGLAVAMARLIEDRDLRVRLIANGLRDVRQRFSWEGVLPLYRRVLQIPAPQSHATSVAQS